MRATLERVGVGLQIPWLAYRCGDLGLQLQPIYQECLLGGGRSIRGTNHPKRPHKKGCRSDTGKPKSSGLVKWVSGRSSSDYINLISLL